MKIILANPRGFCAGVDRAIGIVERALELFDAPIYVRHEVVHNKFVVDGLRGKGAIFVEELSEVPDDSIVIFSAHGVSKTVQREAAARRGLKVFDATCPLVTKVHLQVAKFAQLEHDVVLVGHAGHPEVEGTMGQYEQTNGAGKIYLVETVKNVAELTLTPSRKIAFVTQTTLSVDDTTEIITALKTRFPHIVGPGKDDICYATQNRQDAVKDLADRCDLVFVIGSHNSSNSNRLRELVEKRGIPAHLIDNASYIKEEWLTGKTNIGITAGASAPDILVNDVIAYLRKLGADTPESQGQPETVTFSLPKELQHV